jgi:hypothetical protein
MSILVQIIKKTHSMFRNNLFADFLQQIPVAISMEISQMITSVGTMASTKGFSSRCDLFFTLFLSLVNGMVSVITGFVDADGNPGSGHHARLILQLFYL